MQIRSFTQHIDREKTEKMEGLVEEAKSKSEDSGEQGGGTNERKCLRQHRSSTIPLPLHYYPEIRSIVEVAPGDCKKDTSS